MAINIPLKGGHLSIQNTLPGPQDVHNRRVPLYLYRVYIRRELQPDSCTTATDIICRCK